MKRLELDLLLRHAAMALALVAPGLALAQADRGIAYLDQKDCEAAFDAFNKGMADGEARSVYLVGQMFEYGVCLKVNPTRAAAIYEQAARLGDAGSARALALLNARGAGVPQSYAKAGYWFEVAAGRKPASDAPGGDAFATPEAMTRTYVEAVHDLAEDNMVYPPRAAERGVRGNVVMRFDPEAGTATLVSSADNQGTATDHLGPNKHLFERALAISYADAIRSLPKPELPATGSFATDHEVRFSRDRNSRDGPYGLQGLRR
jgi:hypothetical protein